MKRLRSLGVDLGGTKTEVAVLERGEQGQSPANVIARKRVPTPRTEGYTAVLRTTAEIVRVVLASVGNEPREVPIGVGMPGAVTRRGGVVKNSNTVCLNGKPFRQDLERLLGRSVVFENDANCFAVAETHLGAAREYHNGVVFGVILGTGVGGGIVVGGRPWPGPQHLGGEWGHHAVGPWRRVSQQSTAAAGLGLAERARCYCGKTGCLELYLSGPAIEGDYERRSGSRLALPKLAARRRTDRHAAAALDEALEAFGRGVANLISILDPSAIVLGGGVSNLDCLYDEGVERVAQYVFNDELLTPILKHELGDSAGVLGAALLPTLVSGEALGDPCDTEAVR